MESAILSVFTDLPMLQVLSLDACDNLDLELNDWNAPAVKAVRLHRLKRLPPVASNSLLALEIKGAGLTDPDLELLNLAQDSLEFLSLADSKIKGPGLSSLCGAPNLGTVQLVSNANLTAVP